MRLYITKCYVTAALNVYYKLTNFMVQALFGRFFPPLFGFCSFCTHKREGLGMRLGSLLVAELSVDSV